MAGLYQPSPAIPLASSADRWAKVIDASAREASGLVAKAERNGGRLGKGDASKFLSLVTTLEATGKISGAESKVAATALAPLLGEMRATLGNLLADLPEHAERSVADLAVFLGQRGQSKVANRGALAALASRTTQNMTADWTRLAVQTRDGIVEATSRAMGAGLNPRDAARVMSQGVTDVGHLTYARANTIARTEMADLYDASRLAYMQGDPDVEGWVWRARPDACPICQIQHGRFFAPSDPPHRHHNCRCLIVPIPKSLVNGKASGPKPGDYVWGGQLDKSLMEPLGGRRDRASIVKRLPKSWDLDPNLDLRTLVATRQNPGWRPSLTLQRPAGPLRPGKITPPPPPPPAPAVPPAPPVAPATAPLGGAEAALRAEAERVRAEFGTGRTFGTGPQAATSSEALAAKRRVDEMRAAADALDSEASPAEYAKQKARLSKANKALREGDFALAQQVRPTYAVAEDALVRDFARIVEVGRKARLQARSLVKAGASDAEKAAANRGLLDRLRGTGGGPPRKFNHGIPPGHDVARSGVHTRLDPMAKAQVQKAHDVYPTDWLDRDNELLSRTKWSMADRGYNRSGGQYIVISPGSTAQRGREFIDTAIHEIGHTFQKSRPNVGRAELAFWRHRTGVLGRAGEYPELVARDKAFVPKSPARPTPEWYTLKTYAFDGRPNETTSFEIFTTGVQQLLGGNWNYTGRGWGRMNMLDDEFEDWLWGVLLCL